MTPRDRYRRIAAFDRAAGQLIAWFRHFAGPAPMFLWHRRRHAWARLPENVRRNLQP